MDLRTAETRGSLALALVPPGNIVRGLAGMRRTLCTVPGLAGTRAWLDFPVLAWLGSRPPDDILPAMAATLVTGLRFAVPVLVDHQVLLPLAWTEAEWSAALAMAEPDATDRPGGSDGLVQRGWVTGPFPDRLGMYCATLDRTSLDDTTALLASIATAMGPAPSCPRYSLALVELVWMPGPGFGSSWSILASAVTGRPPAAKRNVPPGQDFS